MTHAKNSKTTLLGYFFNVPLGCSLMAYFNGGIFMKIGYIRVSTTEQNTIRQEVLLKELGVDELFIDKASINDKLKMHESDHIKMYKKRL